MLNVYSADLTPFKMTMFPTPSIEAGNKIKKQIKDIKTYYDIQPMNHFKYYLFSNKTLINSFSTFLEIIKQYPRLNDLKKLCSLHPEKSSSIRHSIDTILSEGRPPQDSEGRPFQDYTKMPDYVRLMLL